MPRILSKNNRVLVLIGLMAASSFGVGGAVYLLTTADSSSLKTAAANLAHLEILASDLATAVGTEEAAVDDYVISSDPLSLRRFNAATAAADGIAHDAESGKDLPGVRSGLGLVAAASLQWRLEVAVPAMAAVRRNDAAGLAEYRKLAPSDHAATEAAFGTLADAFNRAVVDNGQREAVIATTTTIGIVVGFGFMLLAFGVALVAVRRFGHALELDARRASVLNRFTEVTSFASDDREVAAANLTALGRLVAPDASVTHILNRSLDRAVPEAQTGPAVAEILPLHALGRCAGILRGTMYVSDDLADDLTVHCPVYPAAHGTLACVPLISGEPVGAVHLYWDRPNALPFVARPGVSRITEHAALAIGNRRLLAALHGQANTDARTGLSNSRAFDLVVEEGLAARASNETASILMIDVDHFKDFNDRHGHPAGDEALRAFGGVLRSCLREGDVAARYGGEEFAVFLRGAGHDAAIGLMIAERIRSLTESTVIPLGPGITDRITVSIGIAAAPDQGVDRATLLRVADEALYRAKEAGRNRVVGMTDPPQRSPDRPSALAATSPALTAVGGTGGHRSRAG